MHLWKSHDFTGREGHHEVHCPMGPTRLRRHNTLLAWLKSLARSCGYTVTKEAALREKDIQAPDWRAPDMLLEPGPSGLTECADITVVGFMYTSERLARKPVPGWGVALAEEGKKNKYEPWCQTQWARFYAVEIEVFGRLGQVLLIASIIWPNQQRRI